MSGRHYVAVAPGGMNKNTVWHKWLPSFTGKNPRWRIDATRETSMIWQEKFILSCNFRGRNCNNKRMKSFYTARIRRKQNMMTIKVWFFRSWTAINETKVPGWMRGGDVPADRQLKPMLPSSTSEGRWYSDLPHYSLRAGSAWPSAFSRLIFSPQYTHEGNKTLNPLHGIPGFQGL